MQYRLRFVLPRHKFMVRHEAKGKVTTRVNGPTQLPDGLNFYLVPWPQVFPCVRVWIPYGAVKWWRHSSFDTHNNDPTGDKQK